MRFMWRLVFCHFPRYCIQRRLTMSALEKNLIAVCQMTSTSNKDENFEVCERLIKVAKLQNAKMVFLPEACDYVGESKAQTLELSEPLNGPLVGKFQELAKRHQIWLSLGGIHEKINSEKVCNSHVFINSAGDLTAVYRKTHLFDVDIPEKNIRLKESDYVLRGNEILAPIPTPIGKVGAAICYDMRFAELGLVLTKMGAEVITYPSAFTFATGAAHWEVLLRARAIETQCYVVAAAQTGAHNKKRSSWGHAMVVDPWGSVIAQSTEGANTIVVDINLSYISSVRSSMPVCEHRRNDLYPEMLLRTENGSHNKQDVYQFGQSSVKVDKIFYQTPKTIAFTNKRCVVPGHVLVVPIRCVKRFADLTPEEITDMFLTVQKVQEVIEQVHNASSSTITIQDGVHAGQTIEHVHVHILPRRSGDFQQNDVIYALLEEQDKNGDNRSEDEMAQEASMLKTQFFPSLL